MADSSTPFIDRNTAQEAYVESKNWLVPYFEPIEELERLARNKPSRKIDPSLPRITDGTLAAIVQESPKRVVQQTPTGLVGSTNHPEYAKMADIVLRDDLIPRYNRMGNMLQKSWNMIGKSMTWGRSTSYTFFTETNGVMHTDFVIPYIKDVLTEKGKVFAPDSNVRFMRAWYQKRDLQGILNRELRLQKEDKNYKSDWDLKLLAKLINTGSSAKPADQMNPAEREKGGDTGGYEIIHAFQNGKKAEYYSFSPNFENGQPIRTKVTNDPRGLMPLDDLYTNIDLASPLGRGVVELSGGVQNLIDQQMQMFQFMSTMEMAPPIKVFGNVPTSQLKMMPNKIWKMGATPQSGNVEPYAISNYALQNFGNNYGLLKSQILNLNSSQDHSISGDSGNPTQSKTSAGVNAQESRLGVSDNYLRKQFEDWFQDQSATSINIYFSEMKGELKKTLKADDLKEIQDSPASKFLKNNELTIPYSKINDVAFEFSVDASSSEIKEDNDNVEKLTEVLKLLQGTQDPTMIQKIPQLTKIIIDEIGAEGTDELFPELKQTDAQGNPLQGQPMQPQQPQIDPQQIVQLVQQTVEQAMQQAEQAKAQQPKSIAESLAIKFSDLPEDAKQQVLQQIGINSNMPTPQTVKDNADIVLKADKQAHDTNLALANHQHTVAQADAQNQLSRDQMSQQAEQVKTQAQSASGSTSQSASSPQAGVELVQPEAMAQEAQMSPEEQQLVEALLQRGMSEQDVEQAVVMQRQGVPLSQVLQVIGGKYKQ